MKKSHLSLVLLILGAGIFLYTQGRSLDKEIEFEQVPQKQSIDVSSFDSVDVDVPYSLDGDPAQTMDIYIGAFACARHFAWRRKQSGRGRRCSCICRCL